MKRLAHKSIEGPRVSKPWIGPWNVLHDNVIRMGMGFVAKERSQRQASRSSLPGGTPLRLRSTL